MRMRGRDSTVAPRGAEAPAIGHSREQGQGHGARRMGRHGRRKKKGTRLLSLCDAAPGMATASSPPLPKGRNVHRPAGAEAGAGAWAGSRSLPPFSRALPPDKGQKQQGNKSNTYQGYRDSNGCGESTAAAEVKLASGWNAAGGQITVVGQETEFAHVPSRGKNVSCRAGSGRGGMED